MHPQTGQAATETGRSIASRLLPWVVFTAAVAALLAGGLSAVRSQEKSANGEDEFRVFEADLGPAWIDVNAYPPEQQAAYALFSRRCSKCHTLARPINSPLRGDEWITYVNRMSRKAGSGINPTDAKTIQGFLIFDSERRVRTGGVVDPELLPFLEVSKEMTGVRRFPASKRDIRVEDGSLRLSVGGDPRLDLKRFLDTDDGQKLVKWTSRSAHRGELVMAEGFARHDSPGASSSPAAPPELAKAVEEVVGDESDPKERVELILDWLDEEMTRSYRKGTATPQAILADRQGDATEFTRLFVAMANASGLAARTRVGFVARRTAFYFHAWAEVWIDGWIPVDPYLGQFPADATHIRTVAPAKDGLAEWDGTRVPGFDRLELRILGTPESSEAGS